MCGICGFVGQGTMADLKRMAEVMVHRGPDAEGFWSDESRGVYLGHRRLSIIDIEGGSQPMWTPDGNLGVVFNGEIYNHLELRDELIKKGHEFLTDHSDTEVLLYGYREWGPSLPERLNGMWAFAICDCRKGEIFVSRDRFGQKPLFYACHNGTFAFASELKSLTRHTHIDSSISTLSLQKYFAYAYIPAPNSIYERVYKLPAGHNLVIEMDTLEYTVQKYWDFVLEPFEQIPKDPESQWADELRHLLFKAVERRLMSDVPLGVFLSGGIDSSSVISLAISALPGKSVRTFSIGFEEESFDESGYSNEVANILGSRHHLSILSLEQSTSLLPEIMAKLDEPMGDNSLLPSYLLCREARKEVTVALSGDGADELFAGYDPFRALRLANLYKRLVPRPVHMGIRLLASWLPTSYKNMSLDFKIKRTLLGLSFPRKLWNPVWLGCLSPDDIARLFGASVDLEEIYEEAICAWESCTQDNLLDRTLQFYTKLYLQDDILVKMDRASMMNSLEVRSPYLDIDLVNFIRKIPICYKFRNGETKYILKRALMPVLPLEILHRPKKGFGIPISKWFFEKKIVKDDSDPLDSMDRQFVARKLDRHLKGKEDNRTFLWNKWLLTRWQASAAHPG
ncbi:MAG: asparagine synthase (glutamine-hydrolyzing) [Deltaproteobacteria bacterium]|nr:asparagine synthase (glutamine-hydrolyzing) [Deltaproteobacteria bacterium]